MMLHVLYHIMRIHILFLSLIALVNHRWQ